MSEQPPVSGTFSAYTKSRIQWEEPFLVGGEILTASEVVSLAKPLLTEARRQRIEEVLCWRSLQFAPVLENIHDQGNISAVMRSSEAFGFINFHLLETEQQRFKAANRVSKGADKWLDVQIHSTAEDLVEFMSQKGFKIYATHLSAVSRPVAELDFSQPTAIVLGNEKKGVSESLRELCDGDVIIPMYGFSQSFNISVAAALVFQTAFEKRLASRNDALSGKTELTLEQEVQLRANYYLRSLKRPEAILGLRS